MLETKRQSVEDQHALDLLKEQLSEEIKDLKQSVNETSYAFQTFNITAPTFDDEESGARLLGALERVNVDIVSKFQDLELQHSKISDEVNQLQMQVSERKAIRDRDFQSYQSLHARMTEISGEGGSLSKLQDVVRELHQYERSIDVTTPAEISEARPKELLLYLDDRLEENDVSLENISPAMISKIVKRLYKLVRYSKSRCNFVELCFLSHVSVV